MFKWAQAYTTQELSQWHIFRRRDKGHFFASQGSLWTLQREGRNWTWWHFSCSLIARYLTIVVKRSSINLSHHPEERAWVLHHLLEKDSFRWIRPVATTWVEGLPWNFRSGVWVPDKCTVSSMFSDRMPFSRRSAMREHLLNMLLYWLFS